MGCILATVNVMKMRRTDKSHITETHLRKQNQELRQQVDDLKELLKHNKDALRASIDYSGGPEKSNKKLVDMLYRENEYLRGLVMQRQGEVDEAHSKVMISQKMVEASEDYERSLVEELKELVTGLREDIRKREARIAELEKQKPQFDSESMLHVRVIGLADPKAISVKLHDELEIVRQQLKFREAELQKEKNNRQQLYKLNLVLTKQIAQLKTLCTDKSTKSKEPQSRSSDMGFFLQCQKKIYDDSASDPSMSSSRSDEQMEEPLPIPFKGNKPVPKLELRKAKEIQQIIVKKINLEEKKKNKALPDTGVKKEEMVALKKNLNRQMLRNLQLTRNVDRLTRVLRDLEQRNLLLTQKNDSSQIAERDEEQHEPTFIRDALALGKDVYLNDQIQLVIDGRLRPVSHIRSKSLSS